MARITEEQKTNLQMVFNGLARYFKALNLPDDYQKKINKYMAGYEDGDVFIPGLWQIIKEYGTPESRKADTKESEEYWVNFVREMNALLNRYYNEDSKDIIRYIHWFMFNLIRITERWTEK